MACVTVATGDMWRLSANIYEDPLLISFPVIFQIKYRGYSENNHRSVVKKEINKREIVY
jgi:hypothetical protein